MSKRDDRLVCDGEGCEALATMECRCSRCERENQINCASEAVHACVCHEETVAAFHFRMRGRVVSWRYITAGTLPIGAP